MTNIFKQSKDFTQEERQKLLEQFHGSGLGYQDFAKEHNLNANTLKNWIWIETRPEVNKKQYTAVERKKTVEAYLNSGMKRDIFCQQWGISGSTLAGWVERYQKWGSDGLMNKARREDDGRCGAKIPEAIQSEIISLKKKESSFGIKKISQWLYRFKGMKVSSGSVRKTVVNAGLPLAKKAKKKKRSSDKVRRFERARPMQLWQSDITQFTLGQHWQRVYLTVFMDDHSRYIVGWRLQSRQTAELVIDAFKDAVTRFGKPEEVLTDQGRQYFAWRGKSELEKLLDKEGIKHVVSRAHHPQTLGKCERFWETVSNEFWTRAKPQDLEEAKVRIKYFIDHYNHQRPHQGLDGQVPADRFFGIAQDVREVIEKAVQENALKMALGELPRPPAFLLGQVGDQRIAFHGTSGAFYLTHENLGENNGKSDGKSSEQSESVGAEIEPRNIESECEKVAEDGKIKSEYEITSDTGEGALGSSNNGEKNPSPEESSDNNGVLDGEVNKDGGDNDFRDEADKILATHPTSNSWNDSGSTHPTTLSEGGLNG
jgi:transposase InsO family protein/transposase-like protein